MQKQILASALFVSVSLIPSFAFAAEVDAALVPDGTYVVKVEKVEDRGHALVMMQNGVETTLVAQGANVDFSKLQPNQNVKVSLIKGKCPVFLAQ